jgi:predicted ArsR family transcriptional regulator
MAKFGPEPSGSALADEREEWRQSQDTRDRVRSVATGLREPATAATVADQAACSTNAARKHLDVLADLGVVRRVADDSGTRYVRNDAYFRWRRANDLATTTSVESLIDELGTLERREEEFRERFDAATPDDVDVPSDGTHSDIEARLDALSEWETVRESIARHKDALRIARRDGTRRTA